MKYVDASAVLRVLFVEPGPTVPLAPGDQVASSQLVEVEAFRAIDRERLMGGLDDHEAAVKRKELVELIAMLDLLPIDSIKKWSAGPKLRSASTFARSMRSTSQRPRSWFRKRQVSHSSSGPTTIARQRPHSPADSRCEAAEHVNLGRRFDGGDMAAHGRY
jgi:hypothetical protein